VKRLGTSTLMDKFSLKKIILLISYQVLLIDGTNGFSVLPTNVMNFKLAPNILNGYACIFITHERQQVVYTILVFNKTIEYTSRELAMIQKSSLLVLILLVVYFPHSKDHIRSSYLHFSMIFGQSLEVGGWTKNIEVSVALLVP
jgi:hypothetical protein